MDDQSLAQSAPVPHCVYPEISEEGDVRKSNERHP